MQTTLVLLDDRALFRNGLSMLLSTFPDFRVLGLTGSVEECTRLLQSEAPDIVIAEIDIRGAHTAAELVKLIRVCSPQSRLVVLTNLLDPTETTEVLRHGATAYLLKTASMDELAQAIRKASKGIPTLSSEVMQALIQQMSTPGDLMRSLTSREQQVLQLMTQGFNNQRIAAELHITLSTVQFHVSNILSKLEVHNRTEAAAFALRHQSGAPWGHSRA